MGVPPSLFIFMASLAHTKTGKGTNEAHWCYPQMGIPEQINLQYAAPDTVVAAFVTYETAEPSVPATAMFGQAGATPVELTGVSHWLAFTPTAKGSESANYSLTNDRRCGTNAGVGVSRRECPPLPTAIRVAHNSPHSLARPETATALFVSACVSVTAPCCSCRRRRSNYTLHFVKFAGLKPSTHYTYKLKSGAAGGVWSDPP